MVNLLLRDHIPQTTNHGTIVKKFLCLSILLALTGCDIGAAIGVGPEAEAKKAVAASLTDPASVQFQEVKSYNQNVVCGEYNAKNRMGGYVGFKPFIYYRGGLVAYDLPANQSALCKNSDVKTEVRTIRFAEMKLKSDAGPEAPPVHVRVSIDVPESQSNMHPDTLKLLEAESAEALAKYPSADLFDQSKIIAIEDGLMAKLNHLAWPGKEKDGIQALGMYASKY